MYSRRVFGETTRNTFAVVEHVDVLRLAIDDSLNLCFHSIQAFLKQAFKSATMGTKSSISRTYDLTLLTVLMNRHGQILHSQCQPLGADGRQV